MRDFILVDTDVLIDAGRGLTQAVACLELIEQQAALAASTITQMELIIGCRNKTELRTLERFMSRFHIMKLSAPIADAGVDLLRRYRLSHGLLIADALIAATSLAAGAPLVTKNERDYRFISGLDLLPYPQPFSQ